MTSALSDWAWDAVCHVHGGSPTQWLMMKINALHELIVRGHRDPVCCMVQIDG